MLASGQRKNQKRNKSVEPTAFLFKSTSIWTLLLQIDGIPKYNKSSGNSRSLPFTMLSKIRNHFPDALYFFYTKSEHLWKSYFLLFNDKMFQVGTSPGHSGEAKSSGTNALFSVNLHLSRKNNLMNTMVFNWLTFWAALPEII